MAWDDMNDLFWLRGEPAGAPAARGAQAGAAVAQSYLAGRAQKQREAEYKDQSPLRELHKKMLENEAAIKAGQAADIVRNREGLATLAKAYSDISNLPAAWADPAAPKYLSEIGVKYPTLIGTPQWQDAEKRMDVASKLAQTNTKLANELEWRKEQIGLQEQRIEIEKAKAEAGTTSLQKDLSAARELEAEANRLKANPNRTDADIERAQSLMNEASYLRQAHAKSSMSVEYSPTGGMKVTTGPTTGNPTIGTTTDIQKKTMGAQNALQLIGEVQATVRPEDMGIVGVIGGLIDKFGTQVAPEWGDPQRQRARADMAALNEQLMRQISDDQRFTQKDRDSIEKLTAGTGVGDSYQDYQNRMNSVKHILRNRVKVWSISNGQRPPAWSLEPNEIRDDYEQFKDKMQKMVESGDLTSEQARQKQRERFQEASNALKLYGGPGNQ